MISAAGDVNRPARVLAGSKDSILDGAGMTKDTGVINRVFRLLSMLSDHPRLTVKQASLELDLPISTTHRLLRKLADHEYAATSSSGGFTAGMELFRIAARLSSRMPLVGIAEPLLAELTRRFEETSMLAVLERQQLNSFFAASAAPADPMRYLIELNRTFPLVWGASARSQLAFLTEEEIERAIAISATPDVHGRPLDPPEVRAHLAQIREEGFALTREHRTLNSVGIAVPFFNSAGQVMGCMAFQLPSFRLSPVAQPGLVAALKDAAKVMSKEIGA